MTRLKAALVVALLSTTIPSCHWPSCQNVITAPVQDICRVRYPANCGMDFKDCQSGKTYDCLTNVQSEKICR